MVFLIPIDIPNSLSRDVNTALSSNSLRLVSIFRKHFAVLIQFSANFRWVCFGHVFFYWNRNQYILKQARKHFKTFEAWIQISVRPQDGLGVSHKVVVMIRSRGKDP